MVDMESQNSKKNIVKQNVFSAVQPTGNLHIWNYVWAIQNWVTNQDLFNNIFCVVDLHSLTIPESLNPEKLRKKIKEVVWLYLACWINPEKSSIFIQSRIHYHAELARILNCTTPVSWLEKMTQYKSKSQNTKGAWMGLLDYPVLMAADILLYETDFVPVWADQKQHVELARNIAQRFNKLFNVDLFKVPREKINNTGARIMAFDNPNEKMSKSIWEIKKWHAISLLDNPDDIFATLKKAKTDWWSQISFDNMWDWIKNLLNLYESLNTISAEEIKIKFDWKPYWFLKKELAELVIDKLMPIQKIYKEITEDTKYIESVIVKWEERVMPIAESTMRKVKEIVWLL